VVAHRSDRAGEGGQAQHRADRQVDVAGDDHDACPTASTARIAAFSSMSLMLCPDRKRGLGDPGVATSSASASTMPELAGPEDGVDERRAERSGPPPVRGPTVTVMPPPSLPARRGVHHGLLGGLGARELGGEPALVHHQHPVGHAEHLGQLGGDHQTASPSAASDDSSRCTSALVPTSMPRVGSSTISTLRFGGQPLGEHDLLLVAAGQRADRVGERPYFSCSRSAQSDARPRSAAPLEHPERGQRRAGQPDVALDRQLHDQALLAAVLGDQREPGRHRGARRAGPQHACPPAPRPRRTRSTPKTAWATSLRPAPTSPAERDDLAARTSNETSEDALAGQPSTSARPRRPGSSCLGNSALRSRPTIRRTMSSTASVGDPARCDDPAPSRMMVTRWQSAKISSKPVRDEQHRGALVAQRPDDREQPLDLDAGQRRGRLVHDQDAGVEARAPWRSRRSAGRRSTGRGPAGPGRGRTPSRANSSRPRVHRRLAVDPAAGASGWRPMKMFSATDRSGKSVGSW
jgi:hypothetical protein